MVDVDLIFSLAKVETGAVDQHRRGEEAMRIFTGE